MAVDDKWRVPESFDITDRDVALRPPRRILPTSPVLAMLSVRALEDQATGDGVLALFAWQVMAGAAELATQTLQRFAASQELSGIELLLLGHAYEATDAGESVAFEIAQRARKILKQPVTAQSVDASLLLAVTALPYGVDRVKTLLEKLEPELAHGTDEHRAVYALIRAAVDPDPARLDDAYAKFAAQGDALGLAQCALVAHSHEFATTKRPELMRAYLEHAIYRYESDGRPEWAARTISHALVPLLLDDLEAPANEVSDLLGQAAALAIQAKSQFSLESVFRIAAKLGFTASLRSLNQFEPPQFTRRDSAPVIAAAPAVAAAESAPVEAPKKKKGGGKKKKSAAPS